MAGNDEINALKGSTVEANAADVKQRVRSNFSKAVEHANRTLERGKYKVKNKYDTDDDE